MGFTVRSTLLLIVVLIRITGVRGYCRIEECSQWFSRTKEYEYLSEEKSERYCQVLQTYIKCLNDSLRFCRGNLKYHSIEYLMKKQWRDFRCDSIKIENNFRNRCHFLPSGSQKSVRYCALFGDPHIRKLDGSFESCREEGARALVENRYFLVQVTNSRILGEPLATAPTAVTVILRKHNCTRQLTYQAVSSEEFLPISFDHGTTFVNTDSDRRSVEVLRQSVNYIELNLRYIDSSIHIRKQGPYLSVSVRAPQFVLESTTSTADQLCWTGCRRNTLIPIQNALQNPHSFARCYARKVHVPIDVAKERCRTVNVTDSFFDACVFDLMLTGDEYLVAMSRDAQSDFKRVFPSHYHYVHGRTELSSPANTSIIFPNCVPSSHGSAVFALNAVLLFSLPLYLLLI